MRWAGALLGSLRSYDWVLNAVVFVLTAIGFAAIYSVDLSRGGGRELVYFPTQLTAFLIGAAVLFMVSSFHVTVYQSAWRVIYIVAVVLLAGVLIWGQTIRGTTGWFRLGAFSFQPAEFVKVAVILAFGFIMSHIGRRFDQIQYVFQTALAAGVPALLIILQPDLGSALVIIGIWFGMLLLTVTKKRYLAFLAAGFAILGIIAWVFFFKDYQRERFLTFIEPDRDPLGAGYNVTQSIIAVGSGHIAGRGLGFGSQSQLRFLPEAQTDFIFSVIAEELGFVGAGTVLILSFLLLWRLAAIAWRSHNDFCAYTVLGIAWLFFIQMVLNIGAALGLLPVTGVTLPFVSYGGSSLLVNYLLLGLVQGVVRSTSVRSLGGREADVSSRT